MIKFPYTDFHEMNLDWIITTFRELLEEWEDQKQEFADLKEAWEAMRAFIVNYFDNLDVQQEINNKIDEMYRSGELGAILNIIFDDFENDYNNRLDALSARMDTFASLTEGSTTGDAELMDIRVAYNGDEYPTAGDAVRGQIDDVLNQVYNLRDVYDEVDFAVTTGTYVNTNTGAISSNQYFVIAKDSNDLVRIEIPENAQAIQFENMNINQASAAGWATYDSASGSATAHFLRGGKSNYILLQPTDKYFAVCSYVDVFTNQLPVYIKAKFIYDITQYVNSNAVWKYELEKNAPADIGYYVNYTNGNVASISNNYYSCTYMLHIPFGVTKVSFPDMVSPGVGVAGWATYNSSNEYIRGAQTKEFNVQSGEVIFAVSTYGNPPDDHLKIHYYYGELGKIVQQIGSESEKVKHSAALSNSGQKIVMLGDSIIGNYHGDGSIPVYVEEFTKANVYNCGFGGSSMGSDTVDPNAILEAFNGWKVIHAITTGDYSGMQAAINSDPTYQVIKDYFQDHLDILENMDWSTVDMITLSYGTNDWGTRVTLDNPDDKYDTDTFTGAFRTALEDLWTVYPHIKVMAFGIIWRGITISGGQVTGDSDDGKHGRNWYLKEYEDAADDVCKEYHVPFVPMYDFTDFNKFTWSVYFPSSDGTHPNQEGRYVMSRRYAAHIAEL